MLEGVPEEYLWWVAEMAESTDKFWTFTQEVFYTRWDLDPKDAVLKTLEQWAFNVKRKLDEELEIYEDPQKYKRIRSKVKKIRLEPKADLLRELLSCALKPIGSHLEDDLPLEYLPFELLPSESYGVNELISHLQREMSKQPHSYRERAIDSTRLIQIKTLMPDMCYIGTEEWGGYILFEFTSKDKVILECPIEGNATYILSGDWNQMVKHSKYHLRKNYTDRCMRIIHKGNWLDRVRDALTKDK